MAKDNALDRILREMSEIDRVVGMEVKYLAIIHEQDKSVSTEQESRELVGSIVDLIEFFEPQERYEECAQLVKILNKIKKQCGQNYM
jgi:hypothetical protein